MASNDQERTERASPLRLATGAAPPQLLVLVAVISIQLGAAVAVSLFDSLGPATTTFLRLSLSAVLLLVARRHLIGVGSRRQAGMLLLFGIVIGLTNLAFYGAIARIPLGVAVAIEFVGPLGVAALTSRRPLDFVWIGLAAVGLVLLTPDIGVGLDPLGVFFALVAGAGWAGFVLISPRVAREVGDGSLAMAMVVASLFALPFALSAGGLERLDAGLFAGALAVAILSTALPLSLEFEALQRMTARAYGIIVTLEPVAATLVGAVILSQALPTIALVAIACVTVAAIGVTISDSRDPYVAPPPG